MQNSQSFKYYKKADKLDASRKVLTRDEQISQLESVLHRIDSFAPQKLDIFQTKPQKH